MARGDSAAYVRNGWTLEAWGSGFPVARNDAGTFGGGQAVATAYFSPGSRGPTLAVRAGGQKVWGEFPFQYAAFLGGSHSLRGYPSQRFAGDAAAYGSAELRQPVTRANLLVARGTLGVFGLADAGRVWYQGTSSGGWHTAYGGGVFFTLLDRRYAVSAAYAYGEQGKFHVTMGMPF
jgi:hemolysin activation/secretion protein